MLLLFGVPVFIAALPVEFIEAAAVFGEVGGNPIQNHPQPSLMAFIHKGFKLRRGAIAGGGGKISSHLVPPGAVIGVLGHRHQFQVGVPHPLGVGDQLLGQLFVIKGLPVGVAPPGAQMHLIDVEGAVEMILFPPCGQPLLILPGIPLQVVEPGSGARRGLAVEGVGVRLQKLPPVSGSDGVFI